MTREWLSVQRGHADGLSPRALATMMQLLGSVPLDNHITLIGDTTKQDAMLDLIEHGTLKLRIRLNETDIDVRWLATGISKGWQHYKCAYPKRAQTP